MECCCYQRNIQDLLADAKTPCERRFETPFLGPIIVYGAEINDYPITTKDKIRLHQFGATILRDIFVAHASNEESERLDWRSTCGRRKRHARKSCCGCPREQIQRKRTHNGQRRRSICILMCERFNTIAWEDSKSRTSNWIQFLLKITVDLPGDEDDDTDCDRQQRDAMEAKHDVLHISGSFNWNILTLSGPQEHIWTYCNRMKSTFFFETSKAKHNSLDLGMDSQDLPCWIKPHLRGTHGREGDWRQVKQRPDPVTYG